MKAFNQLERYWVILGSASPRRKEILTHLGIPFSVCVSTAEEVPTANTPIEIVQELALQKAENVLAELQQAGQLLENTLIITADTVVAVDDQIFGKPKNREDAQRMLKTMSGRTHSVISGICLLTKEDKRVSYEKTDVVFADLTDEEIEDYLDTGDYADKAGAYGIQSQAAPLIKGILGDYYNVVGFPVRRFYEALIELERE